jgi:hypothetical protein
LSGFPEFSPRYERIWRSVKDERATVAPLSRRRIFAAIEGPCRGENCAKLLTLRIAENVQGFYFGGPGPASELAASILADFRKAAPMTTWPRPLNR